MRAHITRMAGSDQTHWDKVYAEKSPLEVSWRQARPDLSLALIGAAALPAGASVIDVGGGASTLADHLLDQGWTPTVLDISREALEHTKSRLGARAGAVQWVVADIITWRPAARYDLWHDRAVLHFLVSAADQRAYAQTLRAALKSGGRAIIAGFAPGGPQRCSGLPIVQHDAASLSALLGDEFALIDTRDEIHQTPGGGAQAFRYHVFQRTH